MNKKILISLFLFLALPLFSFADTKGIGFVETPIWLSVSNPEEGQNVKIYTTVFNNSEYILQGAIQFFDDGLILGEKNFAVSSNSISLVELDWKATVGDHKIKGVISNPIQKTKTGDKSISLSNYESKELIFSVSNKITIKDENGNETTIKDAGKKYVAEAVTGAESLFNNAPEGVKNFTNKSVDFLEGIRNDVETFSLAEKTKAKGKIDNIENGKLEAKNKMDKPFTIVKKIFWDIVHFVSEKSGIFYIVSAFLVFMILRFIWKFIFSRGSFKND